MIIIPTYNERDNIEELVAKIRAVAGNIPIFFVDDSSPDGTAEVISQLQQQDPYIHLHVRPWKLGLGSAYRDAFLKIIQQNLAQFVITFDADLSHPPEVLPHIIEKIQQFPVVVGSRYTFGGRIENWDWWRRLVSRGGNWYARILTGVPVTDLTSGLVAYRVKALKKLDLWELESDGYSFQIEMKYLLHRERELICEHPITFTERRLGKSKFSFKIILEAILYPLKVFFRRFL